MIKILITDDHAIVRHGLKDILSEESDLVVAGEAASGHSALRAVRDGNYDLVLLDIALPDQSGLEVLKQIRALNPNLPVLMLSAYPEEQYAVRALKAGAAGYLTKDSAPSELVVAVRKAARGGKYVSIALAERLAAALNLEVTRLPHENLSDREFQVMLRLGAGQAIIEIAEALALSPKTISTYRARILEKMGLQGTADIIRYVIEHGLVD